MKVFPFLANLRKMEAIYPIVPWLTSVDLEGPRLSKRERERVRARAR